jgi:hypothetical protein
MKYMLPGVKQAAFSDGIEFGEEVPYMLLCSHCWYGTPGSAVQMFLMLYAGRFTPANVYCLSITSINTRVNILRN